MRLNNLNNNKYGERTTSGMDDLSYFMEVVESKETWTPLPLASSWRYFNKPKSTKSFRLVCLKIKAI